MNKTAPTILFLLSTIVALAQSNTHHKELSNAAISIIDSKVIYDPTYSRIAYPNGDVASDKGVCTDVVIRAYRKLGIDLQEEVHKDMKTHFSAYPSKRIWGLTSTDRNIDHRRVPNLQTFFTRNGKSLPITSKASDYLPGDIVTWNLGKGLVHIGIVIDRKSKHNIPLIVHNIGQGQIAENILFSYKITGHYRYEK